MSATYLLQHVSLPASASQAPPTKPDGPTGHSDAIWCTKWAKLPSEESLVITAGSDHLINTWNPLKGGTPTTTMRPSCLGIVGLDVDPTDTGATFLVASSLDSVLTRWSLGGKQEARKELGPAESWAVSIHPRTLHLATAGNEGKVKILSSAVDNFGEEIYAMDATGAFATTVKFSPDGRFLAVASNTGYLTLFDGTSYNLLSSFSAHSAPIRSLTFTSSLLITASDDKRINVFDLRALAGGASGAARGGGGRSAQVYSLAGHEGWVTCVEARNERLLASGSSDGQIKLWDLQAGGSALATLRDHRGDCWSLAFAPPEAGVGMEVEGLGGASAGLGGGRFVSAGEDQTLRWWRAGG